MGAKATGCDHEVDGACKEVTIRIKPETEQLVKEELRIGRFRSVDEIIVEGVQAWREKHHVEPSEQKPAKILRPEGKKSLVEVFAPLRGLNLDFSRNDSTGHPVNL